MRSLPLCVFVLVVCCGALTACSSSVEGTGDGDAGEPSDAEPDARDAEPSADDDATAAADGGADDEVDGGADGEVDGDVDGEVDGATDASQDCPPATFGPTCAAVTCRHGTCGQNTCWGTSGSGECDACDDGFAGVNCDRCDASRFGADCAQAVTCVHGSCAAGSCSGADGSGHCDSCEADWVGPDCNGQACDGSHFGASCDKAVTCVHGSCGAGTCSGTNGSGHCDACEAGWIGADCDRICNPLELETCYDGAEGTAGIGICHAGVRVCKADGQGWFPCVDQVTPRAEDVCGNGLDDNCNGSQTDEVCTGSSAVVWVDAEHGSDTTGDGSFALPYATLGHAKASGRKLVMVMSDADGTVYAEDLTLSSAQGGITFTGFGPTRPTLRGTVSITHCYDCTFENMEFAYPDVDAYHPDPASTVSGVHNYRNVWRNVRFSAPSGLPRGASLYGAHHGYDNTFVDVEVDDVVLKPGSTEKSAAYTLLNAGDHGTGSQFTRVRLGTLSLSGAAPETLSLTFIKAWGYCDQQPQGITSVRNALITGLDMTGMATQSTSFGAIELGCYLTFEQAAGFLVLNNTFADVTATTVTFATLDLSTPAPTWISGNLVGPHTATTVVGLTSNQAATIDYSNLYSVTAAVAGQATLGSHVLAVVPGFVGPGDYHLAAGSPGIDSGDPALTDHNGTRSDMGAYGGPLAR